MSEVFIPCAELIATARAQKKAIRSPYQDLIFTPDELANAQADGRFCWGPDNFDLVDPLLTLNQMKRELATMEREIQQFKARFGLRGEE